MDVELSLIFPALDEEEGIVAAIHEAQSALDRLVTKYQIIVVNDGSRDGTEAKVEAEMEKTPQLQLINHHTNLGYGAALRTGFQAAACSLVVFSDADCQFDLMDLSLLLPLAGQYDVVCGYPHRQRELLASALPRVGI